MNDIRRHSRADEEIARIREIVGRHALPDFVTGFEVELGEFDQEPSAWIIFHTVGDRPPTMQGRQERAQTLRALWQAVHRDLLAEIDDRYPYYRFDDVEHGARSLP